MKYDLKITIFAEHCYIPKAHYDNVYWCALLMLYQHIIIGIHSYLYSACMFVNVVDNNYAGIILFHRGLHRYVSILDDIKRYRMHVCGSCTVFPCSYLCMQTVCKNFTGIFP